MPGSAIRWPIKGEPQLSPRDAKARSAEAEVFRVVFP